MFLKNPKVLSSLWILFLSLLACIVLFYIYEAGDALFDYSKLKQELPVKIDKWQVVQDQNERFYPEATYQFVWNGMAIKREEALSNYTSLNPWSAEKFLPEVQSKEWKVFFDPENPSYSTLQKSFPLKKCLSALVLLGALNYLIIITWKVKKNGPNSSQKSKS